MMQATSVPVRWVLTPLQPFEPAGDAKPTDKSYLFEALIAKIHRQPLRWRLLVLVGQPGDPTDDATLAWPAAREQVDVGTVTLDRVESDETSAATDINFDPLVLPAGIAASDDPLLERPLGGLLAVLHAACGREEAAERDHARRREERRKTMTSPPSQFTVLSRFLHWTMAAMVLTMLGIGVAMVVSLGGYSTLVSIHRPLGIAILILVVLRFANRFLSPLPPFPATMSRWERRAATAGELTMYGLMFALPLVGWGMLSAARYPIVLFGSVQLPFILPHDAMLHAILRRTHTILAYLFFLTFLGHFSAVLFHTLIARDGILMRMAPWNARADKNASSLPPTATSPTSTSAPVPPP